MPKANKRKKMSDMTEVKIEENTENKTTKTDEKSIVMDTAFHKDFKDIRYMPAFVDTTPLIKAVLGEQSRIILIAPPRFGKSVNLSMLKRFFEILPDEEAQRTNRKLFEDLRIEKEENIMNEHFGKYPVIFLNFKSSGPVLFRSSALQLISSVVKEAYLQHEYLASSDKINESGRREFFKEWCYRNFEENPETSGVCVVEALENLAKYLVKHWNKKVVVLVDEYDLNIEERSRYFSENKEIEGAISTCVGSVGVFLKGNEHVERGVLTGISHLLPQMLSCGLVANPIRIQDDSIFSQFYGHMK